MAKRLPCGPLVLLSILVFLLVGVALMVNVVNAPSVKPPLSEYERQSTQIAATNAVVRELIQQTNVAATQTAMP